MTSTGHDGLAQTGGCNEGGRERGNERTEGRGGKADRGEAPDVITAGELDRWKIHSIIEPTVSRKDKDRPRLRFARVRGHEVSR